MAYVPQSSRRRCIIESEPCNAPSLSPLRCQLQAAVFLLPTWAISCPPAQDPKLTFLVLRQSPDQAALRLLIDADDATS
ncbi:hypothetical protein CVT26_012565 [Gymnopilus dilepis]|uniref:Uncharacterized protein n=1 Tax=Gymnopilus dilepis TaxID=231916 RepID=A0A409YPW3_9AGAR|nr:hypothetical protein CVT26_012565 [Gymnopilus dilepis]